MCGITGWIEWDKDLTRQINVIEKMTETMTPRGPDASGTWISVHCALGHRRLSVIDPEGGAQPMVRTYGDRICSIVYNGEIYNAPELRRELEHKDHLFRTTCDTEVVLLAFVEWGPASVEKLNGIFAYAIWDSEQQQLFLARDRLGVKPLFYSRLGARLLFGSEPKAILAHPDMQAEVGPVGLAEIFAIGPARTPGQGIYENMNELKPGHTAIWNRQGLRLFPYWKLENRPHTDDEEQTASKLRDLLQDTVERQLVSDVPVCTFLSGGLDSSALTALAVDYYRRNGMDALHSFSVDYKDNDKHFQESDFQPNADGPWIETMSTYAGTTHHNIVIDVPELVESLDEAVYARDLPGMADVDSSLYLFCREIKKKATVALSGEAADEIFGGYPWFYRPSALETDTFPWALHTADRSSLLSESLQELIKPEQYVADRYQEALGEVPRLPGESRELERIRNISYLSITRFMPTLLDRKDRMSMRVGLEVRVPYCDHRLVEYVWNIPWSVKTAGGREKGLLRKAVTSILPAEIVNRKKSPYPKTHHPNYTRMVKQRVLDILNESSSPVLPLLNVRKTKQWAEMDDDRFRLPWFGQLMTGPQYFAYIIQVNTWLRDYHVRIKT